MKLLGFLWTWSCLLGLFVLGGCRLEGGLHVVVDGTLRPGTDFDRLTVEVRRDGNEETLSEQVLSGEELVALPVRFNFVSGPGTPAGTAVEVTARAWRNGQVVSQVVQVAHLLTGGGERMSLNLPPLDTVVVVEPDGGTAVPSGLVFLSSPTSVLSGVCSPEVLLEVSGLGASGASQEISVALSSQPPGAVSFYADPSCGGGTVNSVKVPVGERVTRFWFKVESAGQVTLEASLPGVAPTTQTQQVNPAPASQLIFLTSGYAVRAGACSPPVSVQLRDSQARPYVPTTPVSAALSASAQGAPISFFIDSGCTQPIAGVQLTPNAPSGTFHFRGVSGGNAAITAAVTNFGPAVQTHTILPLVRTGTCTLASGATMVQCPVVPAQTDLAQTMMVFQSTSNEASPEGASVQCHLANSTTIQCERGAGVGQAQIQWHTAEHPALKVQRASFTCNGVNLVGVPIQPVATRDNAFVLFSHSGPGVILNGDDFGTAYLNDVNNVNVRFGADCNNRKGHLQVVEWANANVKRLSFGPITNSGYGVQVSDVQPPVDLARTFQLMSFRRSGASDGVCKTVWRGRVDSTTSVAFSRGYGNSACTPATPADAGVVAQVEGMAYERVEIPNGSVQQLLVPLAAGQSVENVTIAPVDPTRTLVFSAPQAVSGQAGGESSEATLDVLGEATAAFSLTSPTVLKVQRASANASARFTIFVVELAP